LGTFFGKKVPSIARHEGRKGCADKALGANSRLIRLGTHV
jgi:hypothetical protein